MNRLCRVLELNRKSFYFVHFVQSICPKNCRKWNGFSRRNAENNSTFSTTVSRYVYKKTSSTYTRILRWLSIPHIPWNGDYQIVKWRNLLKRVYTISVYRLHAKGHIETNEKKKTYRGNSVRINSISAFDLPRSRIVVARIPPSRYHSYHIYSLFKHQSKIYRHGVTIRRRLEHGRIIDR